MLQLRDQQLKVLAAKKVDSISIDSEDQPFVLDDSLLQDFRHPPYYGDMLNGDVYSASKASLLPELQRVGIPTRSLAESWGYFHP